MRKLTYTLPVLLLFLFLFSGAQAQIKDRLQWHAGMFLEFIPVKTNYNQNLFQNTPLYYGVAFGTNYVLKHSNDFYSLGVDGSLHFSFAYSNIAGAVVMAQTPFFLTGKIGCNATRFNENAIGLGLGVGFNFTYMRLPFANQSGSVSGAISDYFIAPAAMAEVNFKIWGRSMAVRYHMNLFPISKETRDLDPLTPINIKFSNWGIGFLTYF